MKVRLRNAILFILVSIISLSNSSFAESSNLKENRTTHNKYKEWNTLFNNELKKVDQNNIFIKNSNGYYVGYIPGQGYYK